MVEILVLEETIHLGRPTWMVLELEAPAGDFPFLFVLALGLFLACKMGKWKTDILRRHKTVLE
jgi:hypothetical protein